MDEDNLIEFRVILEILGKPKEHVETTMNSLVNQIKTLKKINLVDSFISEAKPQEHLFSIFAELELKTDKISNIVGFCFDFMPSSVEITSPDELKFTSNDLSDFLSDLQAKLHNGDMITKKLNSVNRFLRKNLNALMKNFVMLMLKGEKRDLASMSKLTGIGEKDLEEFLKVLIKEGVVEQSDSGYTLK